jgi:hypothetical protein
LLSGRQYENGVCTVQLDPSDMTVSFAEMRILRAKRNLVEESLRKRQEMDVDPFGQGFNNLRFDHHRVRLCFQVRRLENH